MKVLSDIIKKNGFTYKLHKREGNAAIYEQWDFDDPETPVLIAFEVFFVKIAKDSEIKGNKIEGGERFPNDEAFGDWAWTYSAFYGSNIESAREAAYRKFEILKTSPKFATM